MNPRYVAVKPDIIGNLESWETVHTIGKPWSAKSRAFNEGMRMAHGTDDFLIATIEGGLMTDLTGAHDEELEGWTVEDDYQPVAEALGATWSPAATS